MAKAPFVIRNDHISICCAKAGKKDGLNGTEMA